MGNEYVAPSRFRRGRAVISRERCIGQMPRFAIASFIRFGLARELLPALFFPLVFLCHIPLALLELVIGFGQGASL